MRQASDWLDQSTASVAVCFVCLVLLVSVTKISFSKLWRLGLFMSPWCPPWHFLALRFPYIRQRLLKFQAPWSGSRKGVFLASKQESQKSPWVGHSLLSACPTSRPGYSWAGKWNVPVMPQSNHSCPGVLGVWEVSPKVFELMVEDACYPSQSLDAIREGKVSSGCWRWNSDVRAAVFKPNSE